MPIRKYRQIVFLIFITFLSYMVAVGEAVALDVIADDCSERSVEDAVAAVEKTGGGTVFIPEGDCTWEGSVYIKSPMNFRGEQLFLQGSGIRRQDISLYTLSLSASHAQ